MTRKTCPDWLDDVARNEWSRLIGDEIIEPEHHQALAVYSFVFSMRQRVRAVLDALRAAGSDGPFSAERLALMRVLSDLDERLTGDLRGLSATLGFEDAGPDQRHPTRILILDEGVADTW